MFAPPEFTTRKRTYWYQKAFENGVLLAGLNLAQGYRHKRNYKKAVEWFTKLVEHPDVSPSFLTTSEEALGEMQQNHFQNMEQALYWYQRATEHGSWLSPYWLGQHYEAQGDLEQAVRWYRLAAERNFPDARLWLEQHNLS